MLSARSAIALTLVLLVLAKWSVAMPTTDKDKERLLNTVDVSMRQREHVERERSILRISYMTRDVHDACQCYLFEFIWGRSGIPLRLRLNFALLRRSQNGR